jgi:hypothetical protein
MIGALDKRRGKLVLLMREWSHDLRSTARRVEGMAEPSAAREIRAQRTNAGRVHCHGRQP